MAPLRNLVFLGVALAILTSSGMTFVLVSFLPSQVSVSTQAQYSPSVHLLAGGNVSVLSGVRVTQEAMSQTGYSWGAAIKASGPVLPVLDVGHLLVSVGEAKFPNGTVAVVAEATNVGQANITISSVIISATNSSGAVALESYVLGCISNSTFLAPVMASSNGTIATQTFYTICNQPFAQQGPISLSPGQSFDAYIMVDSGRLARFNEVGTTAMYVLTGELGTRQNQYSIFASFSPNLTVA